MPLTALLQENIGVLLLALIILNVAQSVWISFLWKMVRDVREGAIWRDVYEERKDAVDGRLERLETRMNGV